LLDRFFTVPSVELCDTSKFEGFQPLMWDFVHILLDLLLDILLDLEQDCWIFLWILAGS
jgi:hypothetical protein